MRSWTLGAALLLAGCAAELEQRLVIYTDVDDSTSSSAVARLQERHPQVDVDVVRMPSSEALLRLSGDEEDRADVWWGASAGMLADAAARGLFVESRPSWAGQGVAAVADAHHRWHGIGGAPFVFAFNRDQMARSRMPRDWVDLAHVRWFEEVLVPDPQVHDPTGILLGWWIVREEDRTGDPEAGFDWLRRLDGAVADYPTDVEDVLARLRAGNGLVAVLPLDEVQRAMEDRDWLGYTLPESGSPFYVRGIAVLASPEAEPMADAFLEVLRPQELPDGMAMPQTDYARIEAGLAGWLQRWRQEIRGASVSFP